MTTDEVAGNNNEKQTYGSCQQTDHLFPSGRAGRSKKKDRNRSAALDEMTSEHAHCYKQGIYPSSTWLNCSPSPHSSFFSHSRRKKRKRRRPSREKIVDVMSPLSSLPPLENWSTRNQWETRSVSHSELFIIQFSQHPFSLDGTSRQQSKASKFASSVPCSALWPS